MKEEEVDPRETLLAAIKAAFDGDSESFINRTANPNGADMVMIGTVIQLYCYADFSGRRIVDVLRHAALGEPRTVSRLQDAQVFPILIKLVQEHLPDGDLKHGLLIASDIIEMHRAHRHNFAHWMVRRVKGENALVMFSMNSKEARRRDDIELDPSEAKYSILPLDGFDAEVAKIKEHTNYLARTAAWLEREVDSLSDALASGKAR